MQLRFKGVPGELLPERVRECGSCTHSETQNWVPSARHCEFVHSVNVAKTTEVCAGQEGMGWNQKRGSVEGHGS